MCGICELQNIKEEPINLFSDEEMNRLIFAIYSGAISTRNLDVNTYLKIARKLSEGVFDGYGKNFSTVTYASEDYYMLKALHNNIYYFSAAKTYQETREIEAVMKRASKGLIKDGRVASFEEFQKQAQTIFKEYNENYLRAEYNSAIAQSRTASQWQEIVKEKEQLPMLVYHTVGDGRVRPTHQALNGISRPVEDKFWDKFMPPNGWNCRCTVLQAANVKETDLTHFKDPNDVPEIFRFNAGKDRIVFSKKHPYFKVAPQDKSFAKTNFGLPIPNE